MNEKLIFLLFLFYYILFIHKSCLDMRPELNQEEISHMHSIANVCRIIIAIILIPSLVFLIYLWITNGIKSDQYICISWISGCILLRFILPIQNLWKMPYTVCQEGMLAFYAIFTICWCIYGLVSFTIATSNLNKTTPDKYFPIWILAVCTFAVDVICMFCYLCIQICERELHKERINPPDEIKMQIVITQEITTHGFYDICIICTDKFKESDIVKELSCKHIFHPPCIDEWLTKQQKCPTCRINI